MRPRLLADTAVLDGSAHSLPLAWLDDFELLPYPPRRILEARAGDLATADAVLLRSMSRLGAAELAGLPNLRAVATLSSGTDHVDLAAVSQRRLALLTGRGGNARAVADWVQWAIARLGPNARTHGPALVVGAGAVGELVLHRLQDDGWDVLACDPPRQRAEGRRADGTAFVALDEGLAAGPALISLHVPLEKSGTDSTANLLNEQRLFHACAAGRPLVFNAARGGVIDEAAAARLRLSGALAGLALDTFAGEPRPDLAVVAACDLATPHIAGHSIEGKLDVARRAVAGLRQYFALGELPPLANAVRDALESAAPQLVPAWQAGLDACAAAFQAYPRDPSVFEPLRHGHLRTERFAVTS